ncbi:helix-turn-helix transcriptional regulator [Accumulibacter sp.]|nr:helix-turn-helix transcriptional regulator [Accumulibacter sp.]HNI52546.1 helix-turn-helix transcriptional regulator [Accumulibacter sp.]
MSGVQEQLNWLAEVERSPEYAAEQAKMDFAVGIERRMEQLGIKRSELARRLGTSAAAVSVALRGDANLTIERMARMAHALDARVSVHVAAKSSSVRWLEMHDGVPREQINNGKTWAQAQRGGKRGNAIPIAA